MRSRGHRLHPLPWALPVPLRVHGRCSRAETEAAFDILRDDALFSPTTRYRDLALGPSLFHWESQSLSREASAAGQRYIHRCERGGVTLPFLCLRIADDVSPEGERIVLA